LLHQKYRYDVIHEPIPVSPKLPSALFGIPAPVIIGPMNGGMDYPEHYKIERTAERWIFAWLRRAAVLANFLLPGKRRAALLLVANERTRQALPANVKSRRVTELVENGVDTSLFRPNLAFKTETNGLHLIHVGRLVDFKRVDLVIDACSKLPENFSFHLDLVGDGPLREDLEAKAKRLLSTKVTFHGRLQQSAAAELLRNADVMLFASMRESGGAVLLEAMSSAVPVIAANWGGPADYITPETGILIPPATPSRFIDAMAEAILWMAEHPERRAAMGRAGRKRSEELYDWTQKTALILQIYSDVVSRAEFERLRADDR